ncbi:uncharacterized protein LOC119963487 isoform X2 [Scyliorhinus canicula]|uniref:uncharacterized protein LOC119963487 isoform X2 n=1 Tax=Scyliorhinus canicula TaxID=7830 RepID=UPI0018F40B6B|nr:uncharacterized protein LOC119963487 isoform X2 [Scyliorhinus canicula]
MEPNSKTEISYISPNLDNLKKFTIPKKKSTDRAYLEICHTDWREYSFIQSTLDGSKLDSSYNLNFLWRFGDMKLIHNVKLEQRFAEKSAASKLYQEGLNINFSTLRALGKPSCGVYLHRHIDVLLRYHQQNNLVTETIVFFKVLLGKVKTIPPCMKKRKTDVNPTAKFDCHMSQIPPNLKDPLEMQIVNSAVYLYEFNDLCETMEFPRQCLPYAFVTARFVGQEVKAAVAPLRFGSVATSTPLCEVPKLGSCTVAQRLGRGKNAKVVFHRFGKKKEAPAPPVPSSPVNNLGKVVTSKTNQDPRLLKRPSCAEGEKDCSIPKPVPLPIEPLYSINSLMKTLCFLKACSSTPAQLLCAAEAGPRAVDRTVREPARFQNSAMEQGELAPLPVSRAVAAGAGVSLQSTPDITAVLSQTANQQALKTANQDSGLTLINGLDEKMNSGVQINNIPPKSSTDNKPLDEPFFEDIKLYESEVKQKLQKYSAFLVLCDKERVSKIQALKKLSRIDRKAFYCRLKKYEKYYERYQSELGLDKCCRATVPRSHDLAYPHSSPVSTGAALQPCSCALTHGGGSSGCSAEPAFSATADCLAESKGRGQTETTLSDSKGANDKQAGGVQSNQLGDLSCAAGGISHSAENVTTKRFDLTEEHVPESGNTAGEWKRELQSSLDDNETSIVEDASVATESQRQIDSSPIIPSKDIHISNESTQLSFLSTVDHSPDQRVQIAYGYGAPTVVEISETNMNVGLKEEIVASEDMPSPWENGEFSEDRLFSNFQLEEVASSKYTDEAQDEPPNVDSLLDFLAARIEWENLFERSEENELKAGPELASAAAIANSIGQQIPPPAETTFGQLTRHCPEFADGPDARNQQDSSSIRAELLTPGSQTAIPRLQVMANGDSVAEYNQHHTLIHVPNGSCSGHSAKRCTQLRNSTETQTETPVKTAGRDCKGALVTGTNKPAPTVKKVESKDALQVASKELNHVFASTDDDTCELTSKNDWQHILNKLSSGPRPQPSENCTREDLLCALPLNKQLPRGILPTYKGEATYVGQLTNIQSNKKATAPDNTERIAEVEFLNESDGGARGMHTHKSKGEFASALSDNLRKLTEVKNKGRKKSALKPQDKCTKELNAHRKKISGLKDHSKVTSNDHARHVESDVNKIKKAAASQEKGVPSLRNSQHKDIKMGSSAQLAGEPRDSLGSDDNVQSILQTQRFPNHKAPALVHPGTSAKCVPYVGIRPTGSINGKVQGSDTGSTGNLPSPDEGRICAFLNCKRQIAQVASVLSSEASLSKNSRLAKLLTKAVTNLNKAYERVGKSSEIVKRIGVGMSQNPLPKSYQSNCNTFWESCDADGQGYHKRHRHRPKRELAPKGSKFKVQKHVKVLGVPRQRCEQLCKGEPSTGLRREPSKDKKTTRVQDTNKTAEETLACRISRADSGTFQNATTKIHPHCVISKETGAHSNQNYSQGFKPCETKPPVGLSEWTNPPIIDSQDESTPAQHHLVSGDLIQHPAGTRSWQSPSSSKLEECQMELHVDSPEDGLSVGEETGTESITEFPVVCLAVESGLDPQTAEHSDQPQEVKTPLAFQTVGSLGQSHQIKSPIELPGAEGQFENRRSQNFQCEFGGMQVKDGTADSKHAGSGMGFPGQFQSLGAPAPPRISKPPLKPGADSPQQVELQIDSLEITSHLDTKLEGLYRSVRVGCPIQPVPGESQIRELTQLDGSLDGSLRTVAAGPCVALRITEFQVDIPKLKPQLEFSAEYRTEYCVANSESSGANLERPAPRKVAPSPAPSGRTAHTAHPRVTGAHTQSQPATFQDRPRTLKSQGEDPRIESKNEDDPKVEREEGEIASDSESALTERRQTAISQKAGSVRELSVCTGRMVGENHPPQSGKEGQSPGSLVAKISEILQQADSTSLLGNLERLKLNCEKMLPPFISSFELSQGERFADAFVCRDWFLRNSMQNTVKAVHLKPSALHPYVELQMMMETVQFLENKIRFLRGLPTFRSLLWYDETLYGDLLSEKAGYQQQSILYPSFQERVQNNCFEALSDYRAQVLKSCHTETKGKNAYYVYLKHRRELEECSAVMQSISDCCSFCLSVPLTSSINYGDDVESLEALRRHVWTAINGHTSLPEEQQDVAKLFHLWTVVDFVNAKTRTIHSCLAANEELWWFGLEHMQFSAAKVLVWEKRAKRHQLNNGLTQMGMGSSQKDKMKGLILELNRNALCMMYNRYSSLASRKMAVGGSEQADPSPSDGKLLESAGQAALPSADGQLPGQPVSGLGDPHRNSFCLLLDQFGSVGKILERSRVAQKEELEQLLVKCEDQLGALMKLFQVLQEVESENILLTEASFPAKFTADNINPILLNPETVEIYIELIMIYETVHYLKNLMAHQLNQQTYRGMLWFDPALLPELLHNQQDTSIFSLFREKYLHDPAEALERAISTLQQELDLIFEYKQSTNYTYAVQLLSRELSEIMAVKKYVRQHNIGVKTYVNAVPYTASINYGYTESDLTHNYRQLVQVLEKLVKAPKKDLGKMAHIMEAMKSIMDMRQVVSESSTSTLHILTYQMQQNSKKRKMLEDSKTIQTSPKIGNSPICAGELQWSIQAGCKRHTVQLVNMRKRQFCDSPFFQNQEDHEADDPPFNKQKMVTGNNLKSPECQTSSHPRQAPLCTS